MFVGKNGVSLLDVQAQSSPEKAAADSATAELRAEHAHVLKERAALQIILGNKMRPLVGDVQQGLAELSPEQVCLPPTCCSCCCLVQNVTAPAG